MIQSETTRARIDAVCSRNEDVLERLYSIPRKESGVCQKCDVDISPDDKRQGYRKYCKRCSDELFIGSRGLKHKEPPNRVTMKMRILSMEVGEKFEGLTKHRARAFSDEARRMRRLWNYGGEIRYKKHDGMYMVWRAK